MVEYHNGYFLKMLTILNISTLLIDQDAVHDTIATFLRGYHNGLMVEMVEWLNGWMVEWMNGWMDEWMDEWTNDWMNE